MNRRSFFKVNFAGAVGALLPPLPAWKSYMPIEIDDLGVRIVGNNQRLLQFLDDNRQVRAEIYLDSNNALNVSTTVVSGGTSSSGIPSGIESAAYLVLTADTTLLGERVFAVGSGLSTNDGGPGGNYTLSLSATVTAGAGLTGGGALSGSPTITVGAGTGITVNADDVAVNLSHAFTWAGLHTFNAGATIAAGQSLGFGADVALSRKGADILQLATGDDFESTTYASGLQGWHIDSDGSAEFNNVNVRGEIHAAVFTYNEIHATAGTLGVFKSAGKLRADATSVTSPTTFTLDIEDPDTGHVQLFAVSDILRIKDGSGADNWMTISSVSDQTTFYRYTVTKNSGSNATFRAGAAVVDYGPSGQGNITLSADGAVGSSANMTVATHAGSPWSAQDIRVRVGNLNGSFGIATNLFGLGAGDYSGGNYMRYDPTNGFVIKAGAGNVTIGAGGIILDADNTSWLTWTETTNTVGYIRADYASNVSSMQLVVDNIGTDLNRASSIGALVTTKSTYPALVDFTVLCNITGGSITLTADDNASVPVTLVLDADQTTVTGGLNVGSATGAATGEVRASAGLLLDAVTNEALHMKRFTLANTSTAQLPLVSGDGVGTVGFVFIFDHNNGGFACFGLNGTAHSVVEIFDPFGVFSATFGTASSSNIYWSGGASLYAIENQRGATADYRILFFVSA